MLDNDTTKLAGVQVVKPVQITPDKTVRLTKQGDSWAEVLWRKKTTPGGHIIKISKTHYKNLKTGKIKKFQESESSHKQAAHLKKSMKKLKGIVRTNFCKDRQRERHITLTYQENMQDSEKLYRDFQKWWQRMKRKYEHLGLEYIAVAEPQERGAWHMHVLLKSQEPIPWVSYKSLREMWRSAIGGVGSVRVEEIPDDVEDMGQYFAAYFTTVIPEEAEATREERKAASKSAKKGSRLQFYPPGFNFYRTSRGIKKPTKKMVKYSEVLSEYGKPKYKIRAYGIFNGVDEEPFQIIQHQTHRRAVE